jgi:hypothetical protein
MSREPGRTTARSLTLICLTLASALSAAAQERPDPAIGKWRFQHETPFSGPLIILDAETLVVQENGSTARPRLRLACEQAGELIATVSGFTPEADEDRVVELGLRFDDGPPTRATATAFVKRLLGLHLEEPRLFLKNALGGKRLRMRVAVDLVPGPQEIVFDIGGFDAAIRPLVDTCNWDPAVHELTDSGVRVDWPRHVAERRTRDPRLERYVRHWEDAISKAGRRISLAGVERGPEVVLTIDVFGAVAASRVIQSSGSAEVDRRVQSAMALVTGKRPPIEGLRCPTCDWRVRVRLSAGAYRAAKQPLNPGGR